MVGPTLGFGDGAKLGVIDTDGLEDGKILGC